MRLRRVCRIPRIAEITFALKSLKSLLKVPNQVETSIGLTCSLANCKKGKEGGGCCKLKLFGHIKYLIFVSFNFPDCEVLIQQC